MVGLLTNVQHKSILSMANHFGVRDSLIFFFASAEVRFPAPGADITDAMIAIEGPTVITCYFSIHSLPLAPTASYF
jgi:hypothetical protein